MLFDNVSEATQGLCQHLLAGAEFRTPRGLRTREATNVSWEVRYPLQLVPMCTGRRPHPFQLLFETLWVLSGRREIGTLVNYIPKARDYADQQDVWRGAYGPRIEASLSQVIALLKTDPETRRAYLPIHWPEDAMAAGWSKDVPCNVGLHFQMAHGRLEVTRFCRSNDLIKGYAINHFEFTVLASLVARSLGVQLGAYHNHVCSLHLYEGDLEQAGVIAKGYPDECITLMGYDAEDDCDLSLETLPEASRVLDYIDSLWASEDPQAAPRLVKEGLSTLCGPCGIRSTFLLDAAWLLSSHYLLRRGPQAGYAVSVYHQGLTPEGLCSWAETLPERPDPLLGHTALHPLTLSSFLFLYRNPEFKEVANNGTGALRPEDPLREALTVFARTGVNPLYPGA